MWSTSPDRMRSEIDRETRRRTNDQKKEELSEESVVALRVE